MADKTTNINIKYNVDTGQVQRAEAASRAAQKATDELRKSVDTYGKAAAQAGKSASDAMKQTEANTRGLITSVNGLHSAIQTVITGSILRWAVDTSLEMAKLSGNVDGVNRAFTRLPNATLLLNDLRKATHGTVTDLELMQKALTAQNYKIPLQNLGTLLEFAATKAQQTGQEVNHLVDYIVSGIGLRSIKRLDDLGFTANRLKGALGGVSLQAASMGEVVNAVTELMNEDLKKTGGFAETSKTQVEQLEVSWAKLKLTVSEFLTSPKLLQFYNSVVTNFSNGVNYLLGGQKKVNTELAKEQAIKEVTGFQEMNLNKEVLKDKQKATDIVQQEANTRLQLIGRNNDEIKSLKERFKVLTDSGKMMNYQEAEEVKKIKEQVQFYDFRNLVLKESIRILLEYNRGLEKTEEIQEKIVKDTERSLPDNLAFMRGKKPDKQDSLIDRNSLVDVAAQLEAALKTIPAINFKVTPYIPLDEWDKVAQEFAANWQNLVSQGIGNVTSVITAGIQEQANQYDAELNHLRAYYDEAMNLAGDNEKVKKELAIKRDREERVLRQKAFEADKEAKRLTTIINAAAAVINAFATLPYPAAIVASVAIAGETAAQLAIIANTSYKGYKDGVLNLKGPGSETSDSIPARLSKGESVMTAKQTRESFGILSDIRAGRLNDRVIKQLVNNGGSQAILDDTRIVKAIENQPKPPSLVKQGRQIYEVYEDKQRNKRYIRSKNI